jgi:hypothetical protein
MPSTSTNVISSPSLPGPTEASPLLRARYSNGYNDPTPSSSSLTSRTRTSSWTWTRYLSGQLNNTHVAHPDDLDEMPALMSFISLLPPSREMTYSSMERVLPPGLSLAATSNVSTTNPDPANNPRKTSFLLASLLWLYLYPTATSIPRDSHNSPAESGTWDIWRRMENEVTGRRALLALIKKVWGTFSEGDQKRNPGSVEEVLWTEIPLEDNSRQTIRGRCMPLLGTSSHLTFVTVVDLATAEDAPTWFLSHPLVMISLCAVWSKGVPRPVVRESTWAAFDRFSTPR